MAKTILVVSSSGAAGVGTHEYVLWDLAREAAAIRAPSNDSSVILWDKWELEAFKRRVTWMQRFSRADEFDNRLMLIHKNWLFARESGEPDASFRTKSTADDWKIAVDTCLQDRSPESILVLEHGLNRQEDISATWLKRTHELTHLKQHPKNNINMYGLVKSLIVRSSNSPDDKYLGSLPEHWSSRFDELWKSLDKKRGHFENIS